MGGYNFNKKTFCWNFALFKPQVHWTNLYNSHYRASAKHLKKKHHEGQFIIIIVLQPNANIWLNPKYEYAEVLMIDF